MGRLPVLDALRGLAVLAMLTWHSADSWLRVELRESTSWTVLRGIGGVAAPLFLVLAGVGASLAASRDPGRQRVWARGLELLVLGYALRLQTWLLDTGALWDASMLRAFAPLIGGYALLWWAAHKLWHGQPWEHPALAGTALAVTGLAQVDAVDPGRLQLLLRPDILSSIGLGLVVLGGLFHLRPRARFGSLAAAAVAWPLASSALMQAPLPRVLPEALAALLWNPPEASVRAPFPLLPWFSYALVGAAASRLHWRATTFTAARWLTLGLFFGIVAALFSESRGYVYVTLQRYPVLTQSARSILHLAEIGALSCAMTAVWQRWRAPVLWLQSLGRASLRIYWTHLVFVYGVMVNPLKGRLDHAQWGATLLGLVLAMWMLSQVGPPRPRVAAHT